MNLKQLNAEQNWTNTEYRIARKLIKKLARELQKLRDAGASKRKLDATKISILGMID